MKITFTLGTGFVNADHVETIELTEQDLDGTTLEGYCDQYLQDMISNHINASWEVIEVGKP